MKDEQILRKLAKEYWACAQEEHNQERMRLHQAVNDLKMIRPTVLISELPWSEMNVNGELTLQCQDTYFRAIEAFLRRELFQYRRFRADMILRPFIPIQKIIHSTGIGLEIQEETRETSSENNIISHAYGDLLSNDEELGKVQPAKITYDEEETNRRHQLVGDVLGDILPVKKTGIDHVTLHPWDDIARYRGVMPLLISLAEDPEFSHRVMRKIVDVSMDINDQYLKLGLFETDPWSLHCTPILTDELPHVEKHTSYSTLWGRGTAQIFATVSKAMHEEYDIQYMLDTLGQCGLVYYGCCEPLDQKIDIVEKIPNLRKIGMSAWADIQIGAEAIGKKYVVSAKPNPSLVSVGALDHHEARKEIGNILDACAKNGCSCDIVLKDISSCGGRPENIFEWEKIAMEMVQGYSK